MGRPALPDHAKLDVIPALKMRGTPAHRYMWREVGAELKMTETAFARAALLLMLNSISQHKPQILRRAVKRANMSLIAQGYPPVTLEEILKGEGLPERGLLTFTAVDQVVYDQERSRKPVQLLTDLIDFVLGR
ncbi:hypothetical protein [Aeromonas enteropelogenes]|uniref:Uncharacterized protein n=1 Tax=Aeromonas enteropelogenes TaxID=29489 RepID=A0ABU9J6F8_AEREN